MQGVGAVPGGQARDLTEKAPSPSPENLARLFGKHVRL